MRLVQLAAAGALGLLCAACRPAGPTAPKDVSPPAVGGDRQAAQPVPFLDQSKQVGPRLEWNREITSKRGGPISFRVTSPGPLAVSVITDRGYKAIQGRDDKSFKKEDVLLTVDSPGPRLESSVTIPRGSSWFIIANRADKTVEIHLQCFESTNRPASPARGPDVLAVGRPERAILFQPLFKWLGAEPTYQGTGFFVKAPDGRVAAVTSAHFLDRDGPPLLEAKWLDVRTQEPVATFTQSWGPPGSQGTTQPVVDLRSDYLLLPAPEGVPADLALQWDPRLAPDRGERVWFPNKDPDAPLGYQLLPGTVVEARPKYSLVALGQVVKLQSQSGSPVVSQATGKVIGTLSRGLEQRDKTLLLLAPSHAILEALARAKEFPLLRDVIGKQGSGAKK